MAEQPQGNILNLKANRKQYRAVSQDTTKSRYTTSPVLDRSVDWVADGLQHFERGTRDALQKVYDTDIRLSTQYVQEEAKEVSASLTKYQDARYEKLKDPELRDRMNKDVRTILEKRPRALKREVAELAQEAYTNDINNFGIKRAAAIEAKAELKGITNSMVRGLRQDSYKGLVSSIADIQQNSNLHYTDDLLYTQAFNVLIESKDVPAITAAIHDEHMPERFKLRLEAYKEQASVMSAIEQEQFKLDFTASLPEEVEKAHNLGIKDTPGIKQYILSNNKLIQDNPRMASGAMAIVNGKAREAQAALKIYQTVVTDPTQANLTALEHTIASQAQNPNPFSISISPAIVQALRKEFRIPPGNKTQYRAAFFSGTPIKTDQDSLNSANRMAAIITQGEEYGINIGNYVGGERGAFIDLMEALYGDDLLYGKPEVRMEAARSVEAFREAFLAREGLPRRTVKPTEQQSILESAALLPNAIGWIGFGLNANLSTAVNYGVWADAKTLMKAGIDSGITDPEQLKTALGTMLRKHYVNLRGTVVPRDVFPFREGNMEANYKYYLAMERQLLGPVEAMYPDLEGELAILYQGGSARVINRNDPAALIYSKDTRKPLVFSYQQIRDAVFGNYLKAGKTETELQAETNMSGVYDAARTGQNRRDSQSLVPGTGGTGG